MKINLPKETWREIAEFLVEEEDNYLIPNECDVLVQAIEDKLGETFREDPEETDDWYPDEEDNIEEVRKIYIVKTPDGEEFRETTEEPEVKDCEEFVKWVTNY
jgi:hypothetical protein